MIEAMEESGTEVYQLSDEERLLVDEGLDQAKRGQFVPDEDMEKFWNRHRV
jgi:predicted transcriptional regulator